ncbi:GerAB/ArcD/ProY family transporter [Paenibacillus taiwanensis]|uniref:GerAB/ArcD/ProY family transporter n=1 Tax=Paenibacillus taiwanensis TaxID=401638 RepID=UPI000410D926|nr:endospore germination permease [Paenibacillus taiwanensis]
MKKDMIGVRQMVWLVVLFTVGSSVLFVPSSAAYHAEQDGWIGTILGVVISVAAAWLYVRWIGSRSHLTVFERFEQAFGKYVGNTLVMAYGIISFLCGTASLLYYSGSFLVAQIMPETPREVLQIMFAIPIVLGIRLGLRAVCRAGEIYFVIVFTMYVAMIMFAVPNGEVDNFLPLLEANAAAYMRTALHYVSYTVFTFFAFWTLYPRIQGDDKTKRRAIIAGTVISGCLLTIITLACIFVLGWENTARSSFPSYMLVQRINIGNFITRIEVLMAFLWLTTLYFKCFIYFYFGLKAFKHVMKAEDEKVYALPWMIICLVWSFIMYPSASYQVWWDSRIWPSVSLVLFMLIPLMMIPLEKMRKPKQVKDSSANAA